MKKNKFIVLTVLTFLFIIALQSCSDKLCPAYQTYPEGRYKRR